MSSSNGVLMDFYTRLANNHMLLPEYKTTSLLATIHTSTIPFSPRTANDAYAALREWFVYYCPQCPVDGIPSVGELCTRIDAIRESRKESNDNVFYSHITPSQMETEINNVR